MPRSWCGDGARGLALGKLKLLAEPDKRYDRHLTGRKVSLTEMGLVEAGNGRSLGEIANRGADCLLSRLAFAGK